MNLKSLFCAHYWDVVWTYSNEMNERSRNKLLLQEVCFKCGTGRVRLEATAKSEFDEAVARQSELERPGPNSIWRIYERDDSISRSLAELVIEENTRAMDEAIMSGNNLPPTDIAVTAPDCSECTDKKLHVFFSSKVTGKILCQGCRDDWEVKGRLKEVQE